MEKVVCKFWTIKNLYFFIVLFYSGLSMSFFRIFSGEIFLFFVTVLYGVNYKIDYNNKNLFGAIIIWVLFALITAIRNLEFLPRFTFQHINIIFICYTLIYLYGKNIFYLYEKSVYYLAIVSLIGWCLLILFPDQVLSFARTYSISDFMKKNYGGGGFLIFNIGDTLDWGIYRNFGYCFEPGGFGLNLGIAMFFNLFRNKGDFNNKIFYVLFIAMLTTLSTSAYLAFAVGFGMFIYQKNKGFGRYFFGGAFVILFLFVFLNIDFLGDKVYQQMEHESIEQVEQWIRMSDSQHYYSSSRFGGFIIAYKDFLKYPLLGTGGHRGVSFAGRFVYIVNGLAQFISWYGLFGIVILLISLYKVSILISIVHNVEHLNFVLAPFLLVLMMGFSILSQYFTFSLILMGWFYPSKKN